MWHEGDSTAKYAKFQLFINAYVVKKNLRSKILR